MEIGPPDENPPPRKFPKLKVPDLSLPISVFKKTLREVLSFLINPANRKKVVIIGGSILVLIIVRSVFFPAEKPYRRASQKEDAARKEEIPVKVFKVGRFNFEDSLNSLGTIKGSVEFKLSFEIPGVISAVNYRPGERYEEGALLVSLKQDDILLRLKRSQAERSKALAAQAITEEKLKEHQKLFTIGAIPRTTLDKVALEVDQARYEAEAADLEVKANESMLEKSNMYAPGTGTIGELNVEEGETVTQNTLIGSHVSTERVVAQFGVTERDITKVSLGQKAKVFVDSYPDQIFEGTVENISQVIVGNSRTADVRVRLENQDNRLLPGMSSRIKITLYQKKNTLVVPADALQGKENEQFVYLIQPEAKTAAKAPVVVGYTRVDYAQIDSGLKEGDLVVVSGFERLEEGAKVRIVETQEAEL